MKRGWLAAGLSVALLTGCAARGEGLGESLGERLGETFAAREPAPIALPVPPPPGQGRIYFYRSDLPLMLALAPEVIVNGRRVGEAAYERVFYRDALPGRYEVFLASDPDAPLYIDLEAGELRFVKTVIDVGLTGTRLSASLVEESQGRREIEAQRWAQDRPPAGPRSPG